MANFSFVLTVFSILNWKNKQASLVPPTSTLRVRGLPTDISDQAISVLFSKWKLAALGAGEGGAATGGGDGEGSGAKEEEDDDEDTMVGIRRVASRECLVDLGSLEAAVSALILAHNHRLDEEHALRVSFALGNEFE